MNKTELLDFLNETNIEYTLVEHPAVFTVEEALLLNLPHPEAGAKNLFLRDDKKRNYYLLTVRDGLAVDLKDFQSRIGSRRLSFASEEDLMHYLHLIKGSVTPFGLLNDTERKVQMYFDDYFKANLISVHPNQNDGTVYLNCDDLVKILQQHGNLVSYIHFED